MTTQHVVPNALYVGQQLGPMAALTSGERKIPEQVVKQKSQ